MHALLDLRISPRPQRIRATAAILLFIDYEYNYSAPGGNRQSKTHQCLIRAQFAKFSSRQSFQLYGMYTYIHMYVMQVFTYTHTSKYTSTQVQAYTHIHTSTHTYTQVHTHTHTYTQVHTYTHLCHGEQVDQRKKVGYISSTAHF